MTAKRTAYPDECPAFEVIGFGHCWHAFKIGTHVTGEPSMTGDGVLDCYGGEGSSDGGLDAWRCGQYVGFNDLRPLTPAARELLASARP